MSPWRAPELPGSSTRPVRTSPIHTWQRYRQASTMGESWAQPPVPLDCPGTCRPLWWQQMIQKLKPNHSPARGTNFPWTWEHYRFSFSTMQMILVSPLLNKSLHNQQNSSNLFVWFKEEKKKSQAELYSCSKRSNFRNCMKNCAFVMKLYHWWCSATMAIGDRTTLWSGQTQKKTLQQEPWNRQTG